MFDFATIFMLVRVASGLFLLWLLSRLMPSIVAWFRRHQTRVKVVDMNLQPYTVVHPRISLSSVMVLVLLVSSSCDTSQIPKLPTLPAETDPARYPVLADEEVAGFLYLTTIAEQLDYRDEQLLLQANWCSPASYLIPRLASCNIYMLYTTESTASEVSQMVQALDLTIRDSGTYDGDYLFTLANAIVYDTPNGSDRDARRAMTNFPRYNWGLKDVDGRLVSLEFF
jgi:hypothetical protein